ncbi:MAG TPA: copper ion binding protein, partial [Azospira sp.]|nr:copper ion binding protein [Azospira sp.]
MSATPESLPSRRLDLPIAGMTCAACSARIEKVLNRLPGVEASVNLAAERAAVTLSGDETSAERVVQAIEKAGFSVPPATVELELSGMTCAACSARIEKVLNRLPGVEASVNLAAERARIRYVPGLVDTARLITAVEKAGFGARVASDTTREEEKDRKAALYAAEKRRFFISALLTLPLVAQMVTMFGPAPEHGHSDLLPRWLQLLLATP